MNTRLNNAKFMLDFLHIAIGKRIPSVKWGRYKPAWVLTLAILAFAYVALRMGEPNVAGPTLAGDLVFAVIILFFEYNTDNG